MKRPEPVSPVVRVIAAALSLSLGALVAWAVLDLPETAGLREVVSAQMERSGVTHPVTAVLLNFRGYDTLLEVAVLLLALIATWSVRLAAPDYNPEPPGLVLTELVRLLVPILIVLSGYLLWLGAHAPGGAFQAGALLAGAGVLLILVEVQPLGVVAAQLQRALAAVGVAVFLAVALLVTSRGRFLEYPVEWAGLLILAIESAATVSIGLTLAYLFRGDEPAQRAGKGRAR